MFEASRRKQNLVLQPRGKPLYEDESTFGSKMLAKMGWKKGQGLGKDQHGSVDFIQIRYKNNAVGLGYDNLKDNQWTQHEGNFNSLLKSLNNSKDNSEAEEDTSEALKNRKSLEEKSKSSRARVHYHKYTRGKDLTRYSEKDLANIFGKKSLIEVEKKNEEIEVEEPEKEEKPDTYDSSLIINTGVSVRDYFKEKMKKFKNRPQEEANSTESTTEAFDKPELENDEGKPSKKKRKSDESGDSSKKSKRKKLENSDSDEKSKKSKKRREESPVSDQIEPEISRTEDIEESYGESKKQKKKSLEIVELAPEPEVLEKKSKKSKKSKKNGELEEPADGNSESVEENPEKPAKKKRKKNKEPEQIEVVQEVEETIEEVPVKIKKKSKKSSKDQEIIAETPSEDKSAEIPQKPSEDQPKAASTDPKKSNEIRTGGKNSVYSTNIIHVNGLVADKLANLTIEKFENANIGNVVGYGLTENIELKTVGATVEDRSKTDKYSLYDVVAPKEKLSHKKLLSKLRKPKSSFQVL